MTGTTPPTRPAGGVYRIEDEPVPGSLAHLVVDPLWPLLAVMFVGPAMSWPWFVLNGLAVGSPTRRRELAWAVAGFAGSLALVWGILVAADGGALRGVAVGYAFVAPTVWKLLVSYRLYLLQGRSFHLYEHFGGTVRSGILAVALGWAVGRRLLGVLPLVWRMALG